MNTITPLETPRTKEELEKISCIGVFLTPGDDLTKFPFDANFIYTVDGYDQLGADFVIIGKVDIRVLHNLFMNALALLPLPVTSGKLQIDGFDIEVSAQFNDVSDREEYITLCSHRKEPVAPLWRVSLNDNDGLHPGEEGYDTGLAPDL